MPPQKLPRPSQEFIDYMNSLVVERRLTWSALAGKIGVDKSLLTHFRKRQRGLRSDLLQKLAEQLSPAPEDKENTRKFVFVFMRRANQPMFPGFLEMLTQVMETPPDDFMTIMAQTTLEERQHLREQLLFSRLRNEYLASKPK